MAALFDFIVEQSMHDFTEESKWLHLETLHWINVCIRRFYIEPMPVLEDIQCNSGPMTCMHKWQCPYKFEKVSCNICIAVKLILTINVDSKIRILGMKLNILILLSQNKMTQHWIVTSECRNTKAVHFSIS